MITTLRVTDSNSTNLTKKATLPLNINEGGSKVSAQNGPPAQLVVVNFSQSKLQN
jgi:hypothetical protein